MAFFSAIAAGFAAAGTWFAGLSVVAQFAVRIGASLALNTLASAFSGRQDKPKVAGISAEVGQGADIPRSFVLGRMATRGSLAYHNTWGKVGDTPNAFYSRATVLSDLPVKGLVEVWIDGQRCALDLANPDPDGKGFPVLEFTGSRQTDTITRSGGALAVAEQTEFYRRAWVQFYDGTQTAADPLLVGTVSTAARPWTAAEIGTGCAYAVTTFEFDRELFRAIPDVLFVLDGIEIADPRDGGTGTADDLPAAQIYALLQGLTYGGKWLYGPQGRGAGRVRAAEWAGPVADCAAQVPGAASMTDPERLAAFGRTTIPARYRTGLEVRVDEPLSDVLADLLAGCAGRLAEIGTRWQMQVGDPGAAVLSITDDDILSTEGQEFVPFLGLAESVNGASATYLSPAEGWKIQNAPPVYVAAHEVEDGNRRLLADVGLPAVTSAEQVQRLVAAVLAEARRARRHSLSLPPEFVRLLPMEYLSWTSARNGYAGKLMRIDGLVPLPNGNVQIDLTECDPTDYNGWSAADHFVPVTGGSVAPQPIAGNAISGFAVDKVSILDGAGVARRAAIEIRWTGRRIENCRGIRWQVRLVSSGALVSEGEKADTGSGRALIERGILPNQSYEVRAIFVMTDATPPIWTAWVPITTDDVRLSRTDFADEIRATLDNAFTEALTVGDFAASIRPVEIFNGLPTSGNLAGRMVFNTADGKLWRYSGSEWTSATQASDLVGQVTSAQIAALAAAKLTGQITETQIGPEAITTPKLAAGAVEAGNLAAGSVITSKLAVGSPNNWLTNARFMAGRSGWDCAPENASFVVSVRRNTSWTKPGVPVLELRQFGTEATDADMRQERIEDPVATGPTRFGWPVTAGQYLEASVYASAHRCTVELRIEFRDAAGATLGFTFPASTAAAGSSTDPDLWGRLVTRGTVPAGAVAATPHYRKKPTTAGQADSYMMLHKPMLAEVPVNATEPMAWHAGGLTMVTGDGIQTGSVFARHMTADSVVAGIISAAAVNTRELAVDAVKAGIIAAGAVTAIKIAAKAVTAEKIDVIDLSAISADLGTIQVGSANIANAAVGTLQIGGNAVTVPARAYAAGSVTATTESTWVNVVSVFLERDGFATDLQFSLTASAGDDALVQVGLFRDTFLLQTFTDTIGRTGRQIQMAGALIDTAVGTADIFFHVKIKKVDPAATGGWNANPTVMNAYISATQFKR